MRLCKPAFVTLVLVCCAFEKASGQSAESDFILFASGEFAARQGVSNIDLGESDFTPAVDFLYTYTSTRWRALGEYYLTDDEHELERLQLGYDLNVDTTAWVGRYHQPISAWNAKYHHGAYLQPTITRPAIENWEDEGGVLPSHATGLLLESGFRSGRAGDGYHVSAAIGLGPTANATGLHPYDLLEPDQADGGLAASIAFAYYPDYVGSTNFGLIAGYTDINVQPSPAIGVVSPFSIKQRLLGAQVDWQTDPWQVIAAAYYVHNETNDAEERFGGSFFVAYAQLEKRMSDATVLYGRLEGGDNTNSAGYLDIFPEFISERALIGGRIDVAQRQAIALEFSGVDTKHDDYRELRLQWSAVFQ